MKERDDLVDALRGVALFGILAVNIQCFVTGLSAPSLGILDAGSSSADHLVVILTAFLLEFKFYPLFSFCFGYGFAVQTRRWRAQGEAVVPRFTRRMNAMMLMGILHGGLLWFGDILTRYAIAGYVLRRYACHGPKRLLEAVKFWFRIALALMAIFGTLMVFGSSAETPAETTYRAQELQAAGTRVFDAYANGSYFEATVVRVREFAIVTAGFVLLIPQIMVMFLLGALAAQLGLLRQRDRHRLFWKRVLRFSLWAGIPVNMLFAWTQWQASMHPWTSSDSAIATLAGDLAPILSVAVIAAFALQRGNGIGRKIVDLMAPAGRIALTLYVSQSVAMTLLLSGFGLGLGATSGPAALFAIAVAIYAVLIAASHVMQRYAIPGPLEVLWRRYTYATPGTSTPLAAWPPAPPR